MKFTTLPTVFALLVSFGIWAQDVTAPAVLSIKRYSPKTQALSSTTTYVYFQVTFSERVYKLSYSDFEVTTLSGSVSSVVPVYPPTGETNAILFNVKVESLSGSGEFRLDLKASGTGIVDAAGNPIAGGYTSGETYILNGGAADVTPPAVSSINRQNPTTQTTNATSVVFRTTFSEKVSGVNATDFTATAVSGTVTATVSGVAAVGTTGNTYDITVGSISGTGELRLDLKASGTGIVDGANNPISGGYTSGQTYLFGASDVTAPTVVSINRQNPTTSSTTATTVVFRATFSERVTGVDAADFTPTVVSGTISFSSPTLSVVGTAGTTFDVTVTSISGNGTLRLDLKASGTGITDAAGNAISGGFTTGQTYTIQQSAPTTGFSSITRLNAVSVSTNTGEKPQAKVWTYSGRHWAVLPNSSGTYLWRLDGTTWTQVLRLSTRTTSKADCQVSGNVTHILLYQGASSQFVSVEYDAANTTYKLWSKRTSTVGLNLERGVETASIALDGAGRMWLTNAGTTAVHVRWSDAPYSVWSAPITLASNITDDDISAVVALPGKIGVFWSNQTTRRYGFRTHTDGASPSSWSADEVPASQSALNIGAGMADDHINLMPAGNGTLYCAVKTGYDRSGYPEIALLVRRPTGSWDNLYSVSQLGTRPIVVLNEAIGKIRVVYTYADGGGNIVYKESGLSSISFGSQLTLISGSYNNPTSTHQISNSEVVILASSSSQAVGVLARDGAPLAMAAPLSSREAVSVGEMQGQKENEASPPQEFRAYPNPFSVRTIISFTLPESGDYTLRLYDTKGTEVQEIHRGRAEANLRQTVEIPGAGLLPGVYMVRVQTDKGVQATLRLIRIR